MPCTRSTGGTPRSGFTGRWSPSPAGGSGFPSAYHRREIRLARLFADVPGLSRTGTRPGQARHVIDRAFETAPGTRSAATTAIPSDVREEDAPQSPPKAHGPVLLPSARRSRPRLPSGRSSATSVTDTSRLRLGPEAERHPVHGTRTT
ncbi:hypothetical protein [Streptomyces sp. H51]|uniref:hypothetical protein n=1 Tax=Streptomyces sp. H51 TaxID=3111770 RepID=UPI002D774F35|nr:hypothetical protein [Streptomyces sp. H51]